MSVLMSSGHQPKYHPQPVGQPRKGYKWNRTTGTWDRDVGDAVEDGGSRKRPVGAPPKGKKWDSTTGAWVVKPFAESEDTECGAPEVKKPRCPPKKFAGVPGKWNADSGKWVPSKAQEEAASSASAPDESASDVGRAEEATVERLGRSSGGKGKFRKIWANIWPWLICASVLKADETCGSTAGASCPGCALCSVMRCVHCTTRGKRTYLESVLPAPSASTSQQSPPTKPTTLTSTAVKPASRNQLRGASSSTKSASLRFFSLSSIWPRIKWR